MEGQSGQTDELPPKRKRKCTSAMKNRDSSNYKIIILHGKLAEQWDKEKGYLSDVAFVEQLFQLRDKYNLLKSNCECGLKDKTELDKYKNKSADNYEISSVGGHCGVDYARTPTARQCRQVVNIEVEDEDFVEFESDDDESKEEKKERSWKQEREGSVLGQYRRLCPICNKVIERGIPRNTHVLLEHFTVFANCELCQATNDTSESKPKYIALDDFYDHLASAHDTHEVKCLFCRPIQGRHFEVMDQGAISRHMVEKHSRDLMCRCNVCHDKKTPEDKLIKVSSMKCHLTLKHKAENQKQVSCEQCGTFVSACNLQKHIKNMHTERALDENNLCDICGKHFVHLNSHKLSVHKGKESWTFKCETCGKVFAKRYNLEVHSRIHTGERPYICDVCGKGFCQNVELKIHRKNNHDATKKKQRKGAKKKVAEASSNVDVAQLNGKKHTQPSSTAVVTSQRVPLHGHYGKDDLIRLPVVGSQDRAYAIIVPYTGTGQAPSTDVSATGAQHFISNVSVTHPIYKPVLPQVLDGGGKVGPSSSRGEKMSDFSSGNIDASE